MTTRTTTATVVLYDSWIEDAHNYAWNYATDTFKMVLCSSSYSPNPATHSTYSNITNELSGNGYAAQTLTSGYEYSATEGGIMVPSLDPATFSASGGSLTARYYVVYNDTLTTPADPLVFYGLLDNTAGGTDVTIADGESLTVSGVGGNSPADFWIRVVHS